MRYLKNIFFFSASFSGKAGRIEYGFYLLFSILCGWFALYLNSKVDLNNEKILYLFYDCLIILLVLVPMQAAATRRLRDLNANPTFIIFNFIPVLNIGFAIFLLLAKSKISKTIT